MEFKLRNFGSISICVLGFLLGCQCDSKPVPTTEPLVPVPSEAELKVVWDTLPTHGQDPSLKCAPCHTEIVTAYKTSAKYRTSSPVTNGAFDDAAPTLKSIGGFTLSTAESEPLIQSEALVFGGREAVAVLQIGSARHSFAGLINQKLRLLPLTQNTGVNGWQLTTGYRGREFNPFTTPADENCSVCHGLNGTSPSFYGVSCAECHGDLSQHAEDPKAPVESRLHTELTTAKGQGDLCGRCHTHVKARRYGYESQMLPLPSTAVGRADNFRAYQRDTVLDERIAGHQRRLIESKCFANGGETPRCSDCHDPHGIVDRTHKTRIVCLSCHTETKPCLDKRSAQPEVNCTQCHFNTIQTEKSPHRNRADHQIVRAKLPEVYWNTIPQTKLYPDFSPIHSDAQSSAQTDAETALFKLLFSTRTPEASMAALLRARQKWPNTESTLALMSYDLKSEQFESADGFRREYGLVAQLPDKSLIEWAHSALQLAQYDDALAHLSRLKESTQKSITLKLRVLLAMKDFVKAEVLFKAHQDTLLSHAEGLSLLAEMEIERGHSKIAVSWIRRALNMAPNQPNYYAQLLRVHLKLNDLKSALFVADEAIRFNPSEWSLYNLRGQVHYDNRNFHLAVKDWEESILLNRRQFEIYARIMKAAIETGDRNTAVTVFKVGRGLMPDDPRWAELETLLLKKKP